MAYTTPTISASSQTFAQLQTRGLHGHLSNLVTAQTPTTVQRDLAMAILKRNQTWRAIARLDDLINSFLHGDPVAIATLDTELQDLCFAFKTLVVTIDEIGALVDANTGTLKSKDTATVPIYHRTFP